MKVLVLNCGSSSVKYQFFDMPGSVVLGKGLIERIGDAGAMAANHREAVEIVFSKITDPGGGVIGQIGEIDAIGHRVAHGGAFFSGSVLIDDACKKKISRLVELAPLHNPASLQGIEACGELAPGIPQVAAFDTAFHQTIPPHAFMYSIPFGYYKEYGIRKYGFHGLSHKYVAQRAASLLGRDLQEVKLITCHLGNGASITAVKRGVSVDTSMGFTPLEGLTMGTRCGDLDPAVVTFLMEKEKLSLAEINMVLNNRSGLLGLSGLSSDFRDLEEAMRNKHQLAQLAIDVFVYRAKKYIGAYAAVLDGVDALVFTAGLGENSPLVRASICQGLDYLHLKIDPDKNLVCGSEMNIATSDYPAQILVIPTNEELMIARDTSAIVGSSNPEPLDIG